MFKKHVVAIACSSVLGIGAVGAALAAENTAGNSAQQTGSSDSHSMQSQQSSQSDSTNGQASSTGKDDATTQSGQAHSEDGRSAGEVMAGKEVRNRRGERLGRVAGVVVGQLGQVEAFVVRAGKTDGNGEKSGDGSGADNNYVLVPREAVQTQSQEPASQTATDQGTSGDSSAQDSSAGLSNQERAMMEMYQAIQRQQREIALLKQQLAQVQQSAGRDQDGGQGMNSSSGQAASSDPLSQVDRVIVNSAGQVQALVLDSGVVLARGESAGSGGMAQGSSANPGNSPSQSGAGQRQQAIILFDDSEQPQGDSGSARSGPTTDSNSGNSESQATSQ